MSATATPNDQEQRLSVAEFLSRQIALSGKKQTEIASDLGYPKPNIVWAFKTGATKLPITKVGEMARSLEVDPAYLFRLTMEEYQPETWRAIQDIVGERLVSKEEMKLLWVIRSESYGVDVCPETSEEVAELKALIAKWRERKITQENAMGAQTPSQPGRPPLTRAEDDPIGEN